MRISYSDYLNKIHGGWIGKSIGGTIGARFEGQKRWIELDPADLFPEKIPPNDDLDLQVVWLHTLERCGAATTSEEMARDWLDLCWYPFNEYGNFRRNYRLGILPPYSGTFNNEFYETGMGCPIRSEIWGYVFPGAPDLAAEYAGQDGCLDHGPESVGAEKMLAAMASLAFFQTNLRRLLDLCRHYLEPDGVIEELVSVALESYDSGVPLREAWERILIRHGNPEACDSRTNVPFTVLGLLYGGGNLEKTVLSALQCGYDTDCTLATSAALIGQILGASGIPANLREPIGDELVMGIEYNRPEMTLSALARDTARMGVLLAEEFETGLFFANPPGIEPVPPSAHPVPGPKLTVDYLDEPAAGPGENRRVRIEISNPTRESVRGTFRIKPPEGWRVLFSEQKVEVHAHQSLSFEVSLEARTDTPVWPQKNIFRCELAIENGERIERTFGIAGSGLWRCLGIHFDGTPEPWTESTTWQELARKYGGRLMPHHFARLDREWIDEPPADADALFERTGRILGRPAVLYQPTLRLDIDSLTGLEGPLCVYLGQELIVPEAREAQVIIGNSDPYRIYVNGEKVGESNESTFWAPRNAAYPTSLREGSNSIFVKVIRRNRTVDFSIGLKNSPPKIKFAGLDWYTDLAYRNPLVSS